MRKHVTPADPAASIPDPSRGCDLPAGGLPVDWTAYWAGLEARGDITVSDVVPEPEPVEPEAAEEPVEVEADPAA